MTSPETCRAELALMRARLTAPVDETARSMIHELGQLESIYASLPDPDVPEAEAVQEMADLAERVAELRARFDEWVASRP
jgi:hypothetical protein